MPALRRSGGPQRRGKRSRQASQERCRTWRGWEILWGRRREVSYHRCCKKEPMELAMKCNDLSRSLVAFDQNSTLVAVVELSLNSWVAAGVVPGLGRDPVKKQSADCAALLKLLHRWRDEAIKAGGEIKRMVVPFEAGPDGFWLAPS